MVFEPDLAFRDAIEAQMGSLDLSYCFQCGVCSGSCPTANRMEHGPRRIMHMVHLGMSDQVLESRDPWLCVSCFTCSARCPQGIEVAEMMSALRNLAIVRGTAKDEEAKVSRSFVNVVQRHGRMNEAELMLRFYASKPGLSGIFGLLKLAGVGTTMFRKGKIAIRPERIEGIAELADITSRIRGGKGR